jgi:transposase
LASVLPGHLGPQPPQLGQLTAFGVIQRADPDLPTAFAVGLHPVVKRVGADPQIPRDLRDGLTGLLDDPYRSFTELRIKPASLVSHDPTISLVQVSTLRGEAHSRDPDYAAKKARIEHLYAIADGEVIPEPGEPGVVFCLDEFGPLNLQPHPGRQWAERGGRHKDPDREPRPRRRATYTRPHGVRHLFAAYDLGKDKLYGHIKKTKNRSKFLEFCRYLRSLYPATVRIAIVCDNYSPHLTTKRCRRVADWAEANNVEIAYTPTNSSWLNRIEAQFTALRYFALDGTDHASHKEQGSMIRRYIIWRNRHAADERLRAIIDRANVA